MGGYAPDGRAITSSCANRLLGIGAGFGDLLSVNLDKISFAEMALIIGSLLGNDGEMQGDDRIASCFCFTLIDILSAGLPIDIIKLDGRTFADSIIDIEVINGIDIEMEMDDRVTSVGRHDGGVIVSCFIE